MAFHGAVRDTDTDTDADTDFSRGFSDVRMHRRVGRDKVGVGVGVGVGVVEIGMPALRHTGHRAYCTHGQPLYLALDVGQLLLYLLDDLLALGSCSVGVVGAHLELVDVLLQFLLGPQRLRLHPGLGLEARLHRLDRSLMILPAHTAAHPASRR